MNWTSKQGHEVTFRRNISVYTLDDGTFSVWVNVTANLTNDNGPTDSFHANFELWETIPNLQEVAFTLEQGLIQKLANWEKTNILDAMTRLYSGC